VPAIRHYAESCLLPLGINVSFDITETPVPLSPEAEVNLFRWVQGVIGNIVQHSRAQNVTVSLQENKDHLRLCIRDDGIGFDVSRIGKMNNQKRRHGLGLMIAKERMKLIGGDCSVQSQPGKGTTVSAIIPLT
jgi:signal transduction histidine kinase